MTRLLLNAYYLISTPQRKQGLWLILLLALTSFLDFFSIASFLPLIFILIKPEQPFEFGQFFEIRELLGTTERSSLVLVFAVAALSLVLLKTRINTWITYYKARHAFKIAGDVASRALSGYLHSSYTQYTQSDFTKELNRIANLPLAFANNIVIPAGTCFSEIIVLVLLFTGVAWYDAGVFLFITFIIIPVGFAYIVKRKGLEGTSSQVRKKYTLALKYALQIIEALPEIRLWRKERFFSGRFELVYTDLNKTLAHDYTARTSASRTTEIVAAICITSLIGYTVISGVPSDTTLILLTLYAGVSFRAIPSINRIFAATIQMKSNEQVVHDLYSVAIHDRRDFSKIVAALPFHERLMLSEITFGYPSRPLVFENLSLDIRKGEKIIVTGKSGSGKTTLLLLLLQLIKEDGGGIFVDGEKITDKNELNWRNLVGYVPQAPYIVDGSIAENIAFGVSPEKINIEKIHKVLTALDLESWVSSLPTGINEKIGEKGARISGGQRQRIAIARALYHDADVLLLDEITNQLDRDTELEVMKTLGNYPLKDKTIVLITHWPELWTSFDQIYELSDGRLLRRSSATQPVGL